MVRIHTGRSLCIGKNSWYDYFDIGFNDQESFFVEHGFHDYPGNHFSSVPISSMEYREKYPTKCGWAITKDNELAIFSDHGRPITYHIPYENERNALIEELINHKIPERKDWI